MVTRIVKLVFDEDKVSSFLNIFKTVQPKIASFPGCQGVKILKETGKANVFFTYSKWEKEEDLEKYRNSDFFKETWAKTKALMNEKAEAWTVKEVVS